MFTAFFIIVASILLGIRERSAGVFFLLYHFVSNSLVVLTYILQPMVFMYLWFVYTHVLLLQYPRLMYDVQDAVSYVLEEQMKMHPSLQAVHESVRSFYRKSLYTQTSIMLAVRIYVAIDYCMCFLKVDHVASIIHSLLYVQWE